MGGAELTSDQRDELGWCDERRGELGRRTVERPACVGKPGGCAAEVVGVGELDRLEGCSFTAAAVDVGADGERSREDKRDPEERSDTDESEADAAYAAAVLMGPAWTEKRSVRPGLCAQTLVDSVGSCSRRP